MDSELSLALEELQSQMPSQSPEAIYTALGALSGLAVGIFIVLSFILVVIAILMIISRWKIFKKAGEKGWKSIIPIWNTYVLFRIAGRNFWRWFIPLLVAWGLLIGSYFAGFNGAYVVSLICSLISICFSIWAIVEGIIMHHGISKNFGHGAGFTCGLLFLSCIFWPILAFGESKYIGHKE